MMQEVLTWDDLEVLESGKAGASKNILARFMVDAAGESVPFEQAKKQLGALKIKQIQEVLAQFMSVMNDTAVNPPTAA